MTSYILLVTKFQQGKQMQYADGNEDHRMDALFRGNCSPKYMYSEKGTPN